MSPPVFAAGSAPPAMPPFSPAGALQAADLDDLIAQAKELDVNAAAAEEATEQAQ